MSLMLHCICIYRADAPRDGEELQHVFTRCKEFIERDCIPHIRKGHRVLVCSHSFVLAAMACYLAGWRKEEVGFNPQSG